MDLDGYRDYRGVPVIGAWTWNERYGIGSATEVGLDEAYGALRDYRRHTRVATGVSLVLIMGLSGVFAWNRLTTAAAAAKLETAYEIIRGHKDRMEAELAVAHDLQLSMVPRVFPAFPTRDDVSVYATLRPAREVGGDFYDFYFVDDANLFFCVGDVSDKGVPAALFMAVTKTLIRARSAEELSTARSPATSTPSSAGTTRSACSSTLFLRPARRRHRRARVHERRPRPALRASGRWIPGAAGASATVRWWGWRRASPTGSRVVSSAPATCLSSTLTA